MAGPPDQQTPGGLSSVAGDPAKAPLYGEGSDEYMQTIQKAQEDAINALQDRYAKPNWFKVAAGFAKPTGGNFLASLGNALEPLGENVEQERAQQLPIQELKMRIAQTGALMKTTKDVNDEIRKWTAEHPGEQVPSYLMQDWAGKAPDSQGVKSLLKEREDFQTKMRLSQENQSQALQILQQQYTTGAITKDQFNDRLKQLQNSMVSPIPIGKDDKTIDKNAPAPSTSEAIAPAAPAAPAAQGQPTYAFKSPTKLLDNLKRTESGKDDLALNPDSKAMGAYQFLPETTQMLHKQGIKFNPFDENESRIAADKYLQQLLEKNGGDWNKALAAYGGFKTKDPSDYIKKITKDVDFTQPVSTPATTPKIPQTTLEQTGLPGAVASAQSAESVKNIESSNADYINYINSNRPNVTNERRNSLARGLSLVGDPKVQSAMGQLYKQEGFVGGLQTALQEGVNFALNHTGGAFTAQVAFPIDKVITAANTDEPTKQKMRELMRIVLKDSLEDIKSGTSALGGGHMNAVEFQNVMGMFPTTSEPFKLMRQYLATRAARNELVADMHNSWRQYSATPDYAKKPLQNFFNLEEVNKANEKYDDRYRKALTLAD